MSFIALRSPTKMFFSSSQPEKSITVPKTPSFQTSTPETSLSEASSLINNPTIHNNPKPFPIRNLPPEIRHQIYAYYFLALPAFPITSSNSRASNHHLQTALALASPFLAFDVPAYLFYGSTTFSFTHGVDMADFTSFSQMREQLVKRIVIGYGKDARFPNRDWVLMLNECFVGLEAVEFVLPESDGTIAGNGNGNGNDGGVAGVWSGPCCSCRERMMKSWRDAVEDAVREGRVGKEGTSEIERKRLTLSVRSGGICLRSTVMC